MKSKTYNSINAYTSVFLEKLHEQQLSGKRVSGLHDICAKLMPKSTAVKSYNSLNAVVPMFDSPVVDGFGVNNPRYFNYSNDSTTVLGQCSNLSDENDGVMAANTTCWRRSFGLNGPTQFL